MVGRGISCEVSQQDRAGDGASRSIGRAVAERLAAEGASLAVHYGGNEAAAKATVTGIQEAGGEAFAIKAELGVDGDLETLFAGLAEGLGERPLDILVNNAGIMDYSATVEDATGEQFDRVFAVNGGLFLGPRGER